MKVTVLSCFRDSTGYLARYFEQIECLRAALFARGDTLHLIVGEGDSRDSTLDVLVLAAREWANVTGVRPSAELVDVRHGGPVYGSVEHPCRFRDLAFVGNRLWSRIPQDADVVALVESDLIWQAETLTRLIDHLAHVPAVAPMVMECSTGQFYDVYAYRRNGVRFTKAAPYHDDLVGHGDGLFQVDSAGSVLVMRGELARQVRLTEEEAIVGACKDIYQKGGSVWCDAGATVRHP